MGYYIDNRGNRFDLEDKEKLNLYKKNIILLNISNCINLKELYCSNNQLKELDLSNNINLEELFCYDNQLNQLDLSKNINLKYLYCDTKTSILNIKQFLNNKNIIINQY